MIGRLLSRLAVLAVIATTFATVAALGARLDWLLELFTHYPLQYLIVQFVAAGLCVWQRQRLWAFVALLAAVPNILAIAPYLPGLGGVPAAAFAAATPRTVPVRLIAANLYYRQEDPVRTLAYLAQQSADLLVLSEFTPRWRSNLRELEGTYPYFALRTRRNPWGIGVYSKYPIRAIENLNLGDNLSEHLRVLVQLPGGLAEVYAVHLTSPSGPGRAERRNTQLRKLAERVASADPALPKIVAGDFNSTPYSPYFADLLRDAGLRDGGRPFGLTATWPAWLVPPWIPIDHCLVSGTVHVTRVAVGYRIGSDHLPLECTFSLSS